MTEFLRDPIWQFIGAALGLIAIVISLAVFVLQRRKKSLVYEIITSIPLLTLNDEIKGRVQILFEGLPVQNVHLVILHILNDGNVAITSSDYEAPLTFHFGEISQILSAEIVKTTPQTLKPIYNIEKNKVEFTPTLLNGGDEILFKVLLAHYQDDITANARIMGVSEIKRVFISSDRFNKIIGWSALSGLLLMISATFAGKWAFIIGGFIFGFATIARGLVVDKQKSVQVNLLSKNNK